MKRLAGWHTREEIGNLMEDLFHEHWKPELLVQLAEMPAESAEKGHFTQRARRDAPRPRPLPEILRAHADAARILRALPGTTGFERFLRLLAEERELEALETLLTLGLDRLNSLRPIEPAGMLIFLVDRLRRLPLSEPASTRRFLKLCRELHMIIVCSGCVIPRLAHLYFRARAQAVRMGDMGETALFDLLIGSLNVCNIPEHNNARFHAIMARGKSTLERIRNPELVEAAAPYLGIFHFLEGDYDQAMSFFLRVSRKLRVQERHHFEMFYARHWSFAAANRGNFDLAASLLLSRLRQSSVRSDASLSRSIRSQLASLYLRLEKNDKALEQLDIALTSITEKTDITSAVTSTRHLACYHVLTGHPDAAYRILRPVLQKAASQGYQRPLYLSGLLLELLAVFHEQGFPPLPCYSFEEELARCLTGPNRLLQGVACRLEGRLREQAGKKEEAAALYQRSITTLDTIHSALEADKSRLCLARLLASTQEDKAALLVNEAWTSYPYLKNTFWPVELTRLVPAYLRHGEDAGMSAHALMEAYRDSFAPHRLNVPWEDFSRMLLTESGRLLGASCGYLYHQSHPTAQLRQVAQLGGKYLHDALPTPATLEELATLAAEGSPVILDGIGKTGADRRTMLVGFSIDCRPYGIYVLCHVGDFSDELRNVLEEELLRDVGRVLAWSCMLVLETARGTKQPAASLEERTEMICSSPEMQTFLMDIDKAAGTDAAILLNGETGVGKEMLARRIHEKSGRRGRLVTINMASLQDDLFESEFFGHEKGSFTGALNSKIGLVEMAENGTLFLDELTEASPRVQAKLLRVLQERTFHRVGGTQPISINFRLVAASNRHLGEAVRQENFRADLYYRVAVIYLKIPPLRERKKDILPLARYYLHYFAHRHNRDCVQDFSEINRQSLEQWPWPGNIRELRNMIEQSVILNGGQVLSFHEDFRGEPAGIRRSPDKLSEENRSEDAADLSIQEMEKKHIAAVLHKTNGRIDGKRGALAILRISRSALYAKIRKYGLHKNEADE